MNPIKLIRKLLKVLRGGATFRQMFLAILLGFAAGMIPGVNLTLVLCIVLLLILNTNGGLAVLGYVVGKALCLLLAPVTFEIGYFLIHGVGLMGLIQTLADTPVLALLDLHVYCLLGALPLIIVLGGGMAWALSTIIMKARVGLAAAADRSEKARKVAGNLFVRILLRIAFGRQKETMAEMLEKSSPIFLKGRLIAGVVVIAAILLGQYLFLDVLARKGLEAAIAEAGGAEVNVRRADLSLLTGRLVIEGLEVTDAARPTHNLVEADRIVTDVSIADLLARRLVVDAVECEKMHTDTPRAAPGEVYRQRRPTDEDKDRWNIDIGGLGKITEYYDQAKKLHQRIQKLKDYLKNTEPHAQQGPPDKDRLKEEARLRGYLRLSAKDYLAKRPTWVIRHAKVGGVKVAEGLPGITVEGRELSSHPSLHPHKMELKAYPDEDIAKQLKEGLFGKGGKDLGKKVEEGLGGLKKLFGK